MCAANIVICDSGISANQLENTNVVDVGVGWKDENGHGSQITRIINRIARSDNITSIRILDKHKQCTLDRLIVALNYCADIRASVLCLPLSVDKEMYNYSLESAINKLVDNDTIIISALYNGKPFSIPAGYSNVIGVEKNRSGRYPNQVYNSKRKIQCSLPIHAIISQSIDCNYSILGGNSLACALFTAEIANYYSEHKEQNFNSIQKYYNNIEVNCLSFMSYFNNHKKCNNPSLYNEIRDIIINKFYFKNSNNMSLAFKNDKELTEFINDLKLNNLKINKNSFLSPYNLLNLDSLCQYLCYQENDCI